MKFSIIIPCYNSSKTINRCIDSILNQKTNNQFQIEVLAVDNESKDDTLDKINQYNNIIKLSAPNIYPHCWDEPVTEGLRHSTGDWVTWMGSDDWLEQDYFLKAFKFIGLSDQIKAFQSPIRNFDQGNDTNTKHYFIF